jgi:hypothetical protein
MLPTSLFKETTSANTHKRKAPQNHINSEHNSIEKLSFEEVNIPPSKLMVSSLDPSPTSVRRDILLDNGLLYWNSTEAAKLFMPTLEKANCLVAIDNQIAVLQDAMDAPLSIMTVVDIVGKVVSDPGDALIDYQLWSIHQKCQLLFCVLNDAREKMPIVPNWDNICLEGLEAAKRVGISIMKA